jgi:enoyl-CoA hydratase/carnithine racemase
MSSSDVLLVDIADGVATLTLNRPQQGNSLNPDLLIALEQTWAKIETDQSIVCAIITGAGERHFCTGAAVDALKAGVGGLVNAPYAAANKFSPRMMHVTKPVICAVNGLVNGGGLHFVADCDIIVSSAKAEYMDTHVSVGQVSALESVGVVRRCGVGAALLMALTGRSYRMPAERAYQVGMIDMIEPDAASALAKAKELAKMMTLNSPVAMANTKRAIWAATEMPDHAAAQYGWEILKNHWSHPDFHEGPKAFAEKRPAKWNPDANARRDS